VHKHLPDGHLLDGHLWTDIALYKSMNGPSSKCPSGKWSPGKFSVSVSVSFIRHS
jgi:hypothetical protein